MKRLFYWLCPMLFVFAFVACTNDGNDIIVEEEEVEEVFTEFSLTETESRAANTLQNFNYDFFRTVVSENPQMHNVVCAPNSTSVLLAMLANATTGDLRNQILKALGCNDLQALNSLSRKYVKVLPILDENVAFSNNNGIWYDDQYTINPEFEKVANKFYDAHLISCDFFGSSQKVVSDVNNWAKESTSGVIDRILDFIPSDSYALLANALYFKGAWTVPFDEELTEDGDFHGASGTSKVKMMYMYDKQSYRIYDDCQVVKIQVSNGAFEVFFILPLEQQIDAFISKADFDKILNWSIFPEKIELYLPRFEYSPDFNLTLDSALSALGVTGLNEKAELNLFTAKANVDFDIYQKVGVEFNEAGAEGASVNWTIPGGAPPEIFIIEDPVVKFDHPFVFFIREVSTGAVLFAGKISDL